MSDHHRPDRTGAIRDQPSRVALLALSWLVAANTRWTTISVAPLLPLITPELGLSSASAGVLFGLPVALMGLFAIPFGLLADRFGSPRTVALGLGLIALGGGGRAVAGDVAPLLGATIVLGIGIAAVQPALPKVARAALAGRIGLGTAIYATGFTGGALIGAASAVTVLVPMLGSWRGAFLFWGGVSVASALLWGWVVRPGVVDSKRAPEGQPGRVRRPFRSALLWLIAAVFFFQTIIFYTINAWAVPFYHELGLSLAEASVPLGLLSLGSLFGGFLAPVLTDRMRARRPVLVAASAMLVISCLGILFMPLLSPAGWLMLIGLCVSSVFTVGLALPVDVSAREHVGAATGVVLSVGYGLAGLGPPLGGVLRDLTGSFTLTWWAIEAIALAMLVGTLLLPETHPARRGR